MNIFVRAVISGFGFSLGAAIFKRVSNRLGLDEAGAQGRQAAGKDVADDADEAETGEDRHNGQGAH
jgi:hypothetical protein